jgi:hypothetical protein
MSLFIPAYALEKTTYLRCFMLSVGVPKNLQEFDEVFSVSAYSKNPYGLDPLPTRKLQLENHRAFQVHMQVLEIINTECGKCG